MAGRNLRHVPGFNPRPPCGGRRPSRGRMVLGAIVSIHAPHAEGDSALAISVAMGMVSIHAPHAEGDLTLAKYCAVLYSFQSTPPMRRATGVCLTDAASLIVSIHAPHAEGDPYLYVGTIRVTCFNPRPPCGGRPCRTRRPVAAPCFNPRPPCGGRPPPARSTTACTVSIHAPHAEGDGELEQLGRVDGFQSTPPMRRATGCRELGDAPVQVSIHAPHAEGDARLQARLQHQRVSIHAPHAEGDFAECDCSLHGSVSIHAPHAEGDVIAVWLRYHHIVSIHAPHAEGDDSRHSSSRHHCCFNPRPPCGGRPPAGAETA